MAFQFHGGLSIEHHKHYTDSKPIEKMPVPETLSVPIVQHIGKPAIPVVKRGDEVRKGQIIAEASGFVSANVHAPTSGKVLKIEEAPHPGQGKGQAIIIQSDGKDEWLDDLLTKRNLREVTPELIRQAAQDAGIVGMGGASFPTHVKLTPPSTHPIDTVLINGAECEPYLTSDHAAMRERAKDLIRGARLIMQAVNAHETIIGIEENKPDSIKMVEEQTMRHPDMRIEILPTRYPQGAERSLIHAILNRKLPAGKLPMEVGVVVQNINTAISLTDAVRNNIPVIEKVVTVTGSCVAEPKNVSVRIGTSFREILEYCGGFTSPPAKIIMGGPMMGIAQYTVDVPVVKSTSGILCLSDEEAHPKEAIACIRCGRCLEVCPMGLVPTQIAQMAEYAEWGMAEEAHALDCVECGCCTYECPSHRPLVQEIRMAKAVIRKQMAKRPKPKQA